MEDIRLGIAWYIVFVFSTTFHEAAHALAALKLGDKTAYHGGQVSLQPLPHILREPLGMVVFPLLSFILGGWMIGWASTPYDPVWAQRHPRRSALMSLAGPAANLLVVLLSAVVIRLGLRAGWFYAPDSIDFSHVTAATQTGWVSVLALVVSIFFSLNLILLVFNLMPLPPLDGSGAVALLLSREANRRYRELLQQGGLALIGMVIAWQVFGPVFRPIHRLALNLLYPGSGYH